MSKRPTSELPLCRYCSKPVTEAYSRTRPNECRPCRQLLSQLYYARARLLGKGPDALRVDVIVKTVVARMADEPPSVQMKAVLVELVKRGIDVDRLGNRESSSVSLVSPAPVWKVWSDERLASLKNLLEQGKTKAEIAEALSLVEKQIGRGINILRRRGH